MIQARRSASTGGQTRDEREFAMPLGTQIVRQAKGGTLFETFCAYTLGS